VSDERAFLAAIRANPDEDTPRLMYADWLQENGQDARAELVRVQCEMVRSGWDDGGCLCSPFEPRDYNVKCRGCEFRERERALLAAHPELFPPCPRCSGAGELSGGHVGMYDCPDCSDRGRVGTGTGRVGEYRRGMLSVTVPTLSALFERCKACNGSGTHCGVSKDANPGTCDHCDGKGWRLAKWGRELRDHFPQVVEVHVADRRPLEISAGKLFRWIGRPEGAQVDNPWFIPGNVWLALPPGDSKEFPVPGAYTTEVVALTALARACARALFAGEVA